MAATADDDVVFLEDNDAAVEVFPVDRVDILSLVSLVLL